MLLLLFTFSNIMDGRIVEFFVSRNVRVLLRLVLYTDAVFSIRPCLKFALQFFSFFPAVL